MAAKSSRRRLTKTPPGDVEHPSMPCFAYQQAIALQPQVEPRTATASPASNHYKHASARRALNAVAEIRAFSYRSTMIHDDESSPALPPTMITPILYVSTTPSPNAVPIDAEMSHRSVQDLVDYYEQQIRTSTIDNVSEYLAVDQTSCPQVQDLYIPDGILHFVHQRLDSGVEQDGGEDKTDSIAESLHTAQDWNGPEPRADYLQDEHEDIIEPITPFRTRHALLDSTLSAPQAHDLSRLWSAQDIYGWGPSSASITDLFTRQALFDEHMALFEKSSQNLSPMLRLSSFSKGITGGLLRTLSLGKVRTFEYRADKRHGPMRSDSDERLVRTKSWKSRSVGVGNLLGMGLGRRKTVAGHGDGVYRSGGERGRFVISDETVGGGEDKVGLERERVKNIGMGRE